MGHISKPLYDAPRDSIRTLGSKDKKILDGFTLEEVLEILVACVIKLDERITKLEKRGVK